MRVLYLEGEPYGLKYVSGTLTRMGVAHEATRPGLRLPRDLSSYQAVILSNFARRDLRELETLIVRSCAGGGIGLLTVGGPHAYGHGGYCESSLEPLLPVELEPNDNISLPSGMILEPAGSHPVLRGIDWSEPVAVSGYNRIRPRHGTTTALVGRVIEGTVDAVRLGDRRWPLLVLKEADPPAGRVAVLATALAPPWCGGMLGWGNKMLELVEGEEVGETYATFVINLVRWVAGEDTLHKPVPVWDELPEIPAMESRPVLRCEGADPAPKKSPEPKLGA